MMNVLALPFEVLTGNMDQVNHTEYYLWREVEARRLASAALYPTVARLHADFAVDYAEKVRQLTLRRDRTLRD